MDSLPAETVTGSDFTAVLLQPRKLAGHLLPPVKARVRDPLSRCHYLLKQRKLSMQCNEDTSIRRILVIDDNPDIFSDFQMVLHAKESSSDLDKLNAELFGDETKDSPRVKTYELDYASQGREGYEKAKQALARNQPYNLAFVDMRMPPGWDGLETIEQIWQVDPQPL